MNTRLSAETLGICVAVCAFAACYSWSTDDRPLATILEDEPRHLRVVLEDTLLTLHGPELRCEHVVGFERLRPADSVRVEDVETVETRHFQLGKTVAAIGASIAVPLTGLIVIIAVGDDAAPVE